MRVCPGHSAVPKEALKPSARRVARKALPEKRRGCHTSFSLCQKIEKAPQANCQASCTRKISGAIISIDMSLGSLNESLKSLSMV
jgi:hypothetical protein